MTKSTTPMTDDDTDDSPSLPTRLISKLGVVLLLLGSLWATVTLADDLRIVVYPGYGTAEVFEIEGRVIEAREEDEAESSDAWYSNLWRSLGRLINDEQQGVAVTLEADSWRWTALTDQEGYFFVQESTLEDLSPGWHSIEARAQGGARGTGALLIVPDQNRVGIISDVDDTVLISDVNDKTKLLQNTLLKNYRQREAVPGVADFYRRVLSENPQPESAPMFYLSASPHQLQEPIQAFLDYHDFPLGVLITKRITDDSTSDPLLDQVKYKTRRIEALLARYSQVQFVLVGDDGERDPEIYHKIARRYPDRIKAVWIRKVNPDPDRDTYPEQGDLSEAL